MVFMLGMYERGKRIARKGPNGSAILFLTCLYIFLFQTVSALSPVPLSDVITGPGSYNLDPNVEYYYGTLDMVDWPSSVTIIGNGATIRDTNVSRGPQIYIRSGEMTLRNCNLVSENNKTFIMAESAQVVAEGTTTFSGHETALLLMSVSYVNFSGTRLTNVAHAFMMSGGARGAISGCTISGRGSGTGKGIQLSNPVAEPVEVTDSVFDNFEFCIFSNLGSRLNVRRCNFASMTVGVSHEEVSGVVEVMDSTFDSSIPESKGIQASGNMDITVRNCAFNNIEFGLLAKNGTRLNVTGDTKGDTRFTNVGHGFILFGGAHGSISNCILGGKGSSIGKGIQLSDPVAEPVTVTDCDFSSFEFCILANNGSRLNAQRCNFSNMSVGVNYYGAFGDVSDSQFGSQNFPLKSQTRGILTDGDLNFSYRNCTFTNLEFGIQILNAGVSAIANTRYIGCKNGIFAGGGSSITVSAGAVFENLQTNNEEPPRGMLVVEGSTCTISSPASFTNFFNGEGININGDSINGFSELTVLSERKEDFTFERVGRCIVVDHGHFVVDKIRMLNCGKGLDVLGAGTAGRYCEWKNSDYIVDALTPAERETSDALASIDSFLTIENNYIDGCSGGVICAENDNSVVRNNVILNMRTNAINFTRSQGGVAYGNFCQYTDEYDLIYIGNSNDVSIYDNVLLDGADNGVFCEDASNVNVYRNVIIGVWNVGIGSVMQISLEPQGSFVTAHDNTILNCGNSSLKCDERSWLHAYRNICGVVSGAAYPSTRRHTDFPSDKLVSPFETNSRGATVRDNLLFGSLTQGVNITGLSGGFITSSIAEFYNNAVVDSQGQGLRLVDNGSNLSIIRNYLDRNNLSNAQVPVEILSSTPTFHYNVFGSYPGSRLLYADPGGIDVTYNYWGQDSGPSNPLYVEGGNYIPFLTSQEIFHAYSASLGSVGGAVQWNSNDSVGVSVEATLKESPDTSGNTYIVSAAKFTTPPQEISPLDQAIAYYNILIDERILRESVSIRISLRTLSGDAAQLGFWSYDPVTSRWNLIVVGVDTREVGAEFTPEALPQTYFAMTTSGPPSFPSRWYVAEGATYPEFDTFLLLANMNPETINVGIDFLPERVNNTHIDLAVPANSRWTVKVDDYIENDGVSAVLTEASGKGFVVERAMYLAEPGGRWYGGHGAVAIAEPRPEWFLAEGATVTAGPAGSPFETYILIANPNPNDVDVVLTFFPEGEASFEHTFRARANSRLTVNAATLDPRLVNKSFSTRVRSTAGEGILVDRAMWWRATNWPLSGFMEGNASPGLSELSTEWYLAEGNTDNFDDFILIVNPSDSAANVQIRYLREGAGPVTRSLTVGTKQRKTINVRYDPEGLGSAARHGTAITSSVPIAVERSMYWSGGGYGWVGGHNSFASPVIATQWVLPEGATVPIAYGNLETYILLANPGSIAADVTIRFLLEDGSIITKNYTISASQCLTIIASDIAELTDKAFSTVVSSNVLIVVERSMYWETDTPGVIQPVGGTCSLGIPQGITPLQNYEMETLPDLVREAVTETLNPEIYGEDVTNAYDRDDDNDGTTDEGEIPRGYDRLDPTSTPLRQTGIEDWKLYE